MRFYYDTEFHERGPDYPIDFISIGIVSEHGDAYYAVHSGFDFEAAMNNDWLRRNVMPFIPTTEFFPSIQIAHPDVKPRWVIRDEIKAFIFDLAQNAQDSEIELWADYADYDHVVFAQIFGRMIDLPEGIPMRTEDIRQEIKRLGIPEDKLPKQDPTTEHHALLDAQYNRVLHGFILGYGK